MSQDSEQIRTFVAIELPEAVKALLRDVREKLSPSLRGASWVRPEGIHLTLKFLGGISPARVGEVAAALERASAGSRAFALSAAGVGAFPKPARARVLWVGVNDSSGGCADLQPRIDAELHSLGFPLDDRPYSPHLTLARFKFPAPLPPEVLDFAFAETSFHVENIFLFRSELRPSGAVYSKLKSISLPTAK